MLRRLRFFYWRGFWFFYWRSNNRWFFFILIFVLAFILIFVFLISLSRKYPFYLCFFALILVTSIGSVKAYCSNKFIALIRIYFPETYILSYTASLQKFCSRSFVYITSPLYHSKLQFIQKVIFLFLSPILSALM